MFGGSDDLHTGEGMQGEQIRVSGHDAGCVAVDGQLQNEVVLGISAGANGRSDLDQLRFAGERDEKPVPLLSRDVPVEFLARKHIAQLVKEWNRNQNHASVELLGRRPVPAPRR